MEEREHTTIEDVTFEILAASIAFLTEMKGNNKEKFLEYAPGVHHMCIEYSQMYRTPMRETLTGRRTS